MKALKLLVIVGVLCLGAALPAAAQIHLSIAPSTLNIPDSVNLGTNFSYYVNVTNDSLGTGPGQLSFAYTINGGAPTLATGDTAQAGISGDTGVVNFNGHDSFTRFLHINFTGPAFVAGPSVVVIWPVLLNRDYTTDTFTKTMVVYDPLATENIDQDKYRVYMYGQQLFVATAQQNTVDYVRIYDTQGEQVLNQSYTGHPISLQQLATGAYFVELGLANKTRRIFKVVNTQ